MIGEPIRARWFDGRNSQAQPVLVRLESSPQGPELLLHPLSQPGTAPLRIAHRDIGWPEAWSGNRAPRVVVVDLGPHGSLEVDDAMAWRAAAAAAGGRAPLSQRMQTHWRVFVLVLLVAGAGLWAFYRWGTPFAATQLTRQVPLNWETSLAQRAMNDLDGSWLKPSKLPPQRQAELRARFDALARDVGPALRRYAGYAPQLQLHFRSGMGANAFALPGGIIVMTDGLVEAAAKQKLTDDALVGVLAHEIGHVMHRHTTRMVVEQGVLNVGLGLALGDMSGVLSVGGSLLTGLAYRRSHETEADCFALALMRQAKLPTQPMADLLLVLDRDEDDDNAHQAEPQGGSWANVLSSHPATHERAQLLKQGRSDCR